MDRATPIDSPLAFRIDDEPPEVESLWDVAQSLIANNGREFAQEVAILSRAKAEAEGEVERGQFWRAVLAEVATVG